MQGLDRTVDINSLGAIDRAISLLPMGGTCMLCGETIATVPPYNHCVVYNVVISNILLNLGVNYGNKI